MNGEFIKRLEKAYEEDKLEYSICDGDGFHYQVLTVPDECTLKSLGVRYDFAEEEKYLYVN